MSTNSPRIGGAQSCRLQVAQDRALPDEQHSLAQLRDKFQTLLDEKDHEPLALIQLTEHHDQLLDGRGLKAFDRSSKRVVVATTSSGRQRMVKTAETVGRSPTRRSLSAFASSLLHHSPRSGAHVPHQHCADERFDAPDGWRN